MLGASNGSGSPKFRSYNKNIFSKDQLEIIKKMKNEQRQEKPLESQPLEKAINKVVDSSSYVQNQLRIKQVGAEKTGELQVNDSQKVVFYNTKGEGDCAIHALFGKEIDVSFSCEDVAAKRKEFSYGIATCQSGSDLEKLFHFHLKYISVTASYSPYSRSKRMTSKME